MSEKHFIYVTAASGGYLVEVNDGFLKNETGPSGVWIVRTQEELAGLLAKIAMQIQDPNPHGANHK